jgi:5'-nucleotidase/UDP-sugar diphosphatase
MKTSTLFPLLGILVSFSRDTWADSRALQDATFELNILHVNDHHSHLAEADFELDPTLLSIEVDGSALSVRYGGYPRLVSLSRSLGATMTNVLKLHAGDALFGTSLYSVYRGDADAEMMEAFCFDAFELGNHEFDDGDAKLAEFITKLRDSITCPNTPVLAANLVPGPDSPLLPLQQSGAITARIVKSFGDEQVGVIGIDIRNKTLLSSSPDPGTDFLDERETARAQVSELTALGVNKIVLLTHVGLGNDLEWMVGIEGVDVVIGGDSHTLLGLDVAPVFNPSGAYPAPSVTMTATTRQSDGRTVCVVTAWEYAHLLGHLNVIFDAAGDVLSCGGSPLVPFEVNATAPDSEIVKSYLEDLGPAFVHVEEDEQTKAALQVYLDEIEIRLGDVIATVPEDICYDRIPGQGRSLICPKESTAEMGGAACNLVAQAFLDQTPQADLAIQNGGGCRTDIAAGDFTLDDAITLLPFSNTLVTLAVTGAQIKVVLEEALENTFVVNGSSGAYPYAAGLRYSVNANGEMGSRISGLEVNIRAEQESWKAIDAETTYTVVTNSFIARGQDGYFEFGRVDEALVVDTFTEYSQVFIDYAIQEGTLLNPNPDDFSTQSFVALGEDETATLRGEDETPGDENSSAGKSFISLFAMTVTLVASLAFSV